ncbi:hypothetical protein [Natrinema salinisoli]|uniref:hypothetical protein n=1 Tax=Natrinema salinisoli TaxID=2878535 RepID=UPI001CF04BF3|nr:hypothetical protein [Natrinema salinisoli]
MNWATPSEAAVTMILIVIAALPVALVTENVHAAALTGVVAVTVCNVAYWKWRQYSDDVLVEEYGTPWYVPGGDDR